MDALDRTLRHRLTRAGEDMALHPLRPAVALQPPRRTLRPLAAALALAALIALAGGVAGLHARFTDRGGAPASKAKAAPTMTMLQQSHEQGGIAGQSQAPSGGGAGMAEWDSTHDDAVLLIPADANHGPGGTWTWNGTWHRQSAPPPDDVRYGDAMVNMPPLHGVVTFGSSSVWLWTGTTWVAQGRLPFSAGYTGYATSAAYDPRRGELVVLANDGDVNGTGTHTTVPPQTWTWDGHTWRHRPSAPDIEPFGQGAAWDPDAGAVVVAGTASNGPATAWSFDGSAWKRFAPAAGSPLPDSAPGLAWDPVGHTLMTLLDVDEPFEATTHAAGTAGTIPARVLRVSPAGWSEVVPTEHPGDTLAPLVTDIAGGRVLAIGLRPVSSLQHRQVTKQSEPYVVMEWTGTTWRVVSS